MDPQRIIPVDAGIWGVVYDMVRDRPDTPQRIKDMVLANAEGEAV